MRLKEYTVMRGVLHCETGLRIGGRREELGIEVQDNPVLKHPLTDLPYVPGSSIKGKMRSLLEMRHSQRTQETGKPCDCGGCLVCRIFGSHHISRGKEPTRILVRDAFLTAESEQNLREIRQDKGTAAEVKSENIIDRKTGTAARGGLRTQERVPAGTEFNMEITLRIFDADSKDEITEFVKEGLGLLQKDYLGGSGSRGYGKITIRNLKEEVRDLADAGI